MTKKKEVVTAARTNLESISPSFDGDTKFIELEFAEINEHIRSTSQLLVGWYTFYITASVAGVLSILDKVHLHDIETNDDKVVIMGFYFSILYIISTSLSMYMVYRSRVLFVNRFNRLFLLKDYLNKNIKGFTFELPVPRRKFVGLCDIMNASLLPMLLAWIAVLIFSILFLIGNLQDGRILITPYHT